jgi:hypothetical protein
MHLINKSPFNKPASVLATHTSDMSMLPQIKTHTATVRIISFHPGRIGINSTILTATSVKSDIIPIAKSTIALTSLYAYKSL